VIDEQKIKKCDFGKKTGHTRDKCFKFKSKKEIINFAGKSIGQEESLDASFTTISKAFNCRSESEGEIDFVLDSGCTKHIVQNSQNIYDFLKWCYAITTANGQKAYSSGYGKMDCMIKMAKQGYTSKESMFFLILVLYSSQF
jgi:hypothetical protein